MQLLADQVALLAFRTGKCAYQKDDGNTVRVRARGQACRKVNAREMPRIYSLVAQHPHQQLGRQIIGRCAQTYANDDGATRHAKGPLIPPGQLLALQPQPASGIQLIEHGATMTAL